MSSFAKCKATLLATQEAWQEVERQWEAELAQELAELEEMEVSGKWWKMEIIRNTYKLRWQSGNWAACYDVMNISNSKMKSWQRESDRNRL